MLVNLVFLILLLECHPKMLAKIVKLNVFMKESVYLPVHPTQLHILIIVAFKFAENKLVLKDK